MAAHARPIAVFRLEVLGLPYRRPLPVKIHNGSITAVEVRDGPPSERDPKASLPALSSLALEPRAERGSHQTPRYLHHYARFVKLLLAWSKTSCRLKSLLCMPPPRMFALLDIRRNHARCYLPCCLLAYHTPPAAAAAATPQTTAA
jgi:hypothetical protein